VRERWARVLQGHIFFSDHLQSLNAKEPFTGGPENEKEHSSQESRPSDKGEQLSPFSLALRWMQN
jgi:hypothetical protein